MSVVKLLRTQGLYLEPHAPASLTVAELQALLDVVEAAQEYRTYLPSGDISGAGKHAAMNHKAKAVHDSLDALEKVKPDGR